MAYTETTSGLRPAQHWTVDDIERGLRIFAVLALVATLGFAAAEITRSGGATVPPSAALTDWHGNVATSGR